MIHKQNPVGHLSGKSHLVRDYHHGDVDAGKLNHYVQNLLNGFGVQCAGRFIKQNNFLLCIQCPCNGNSLLLAAAQCSGVHMCLIAQANNIQIFIGDLFRILLAHVLQLNGRQRNVLQNGHVRVKIKLLEDHRNILADNIVLIFRCQLCPVNEYLTGGWFLQKIHAANHCAFARTGRPDYYQLFSFFYGKTDVLQYFQITEAFTDMF